MMEHPANTVPTFRDNGADLTRYRALRNSPNVSEDNGLKVNVPQDNSEINRAHCSVGQSASLLAVSKPLRTIQLG